MEQRRKHLAHLVAALALLALPIACVAPASAPAPSAARAPAAEVLYEVRLPAGTVPGFDVMFRGDNRTRYTLPAGFTGFRFVGAGRGLTHVQAPHGPTEYHDSAIFIGPFNGPVVLESMTIHGARRKAVHAGLATKSLVNGKYLVTRPVLPQFQLRMRDVEVVADVLPDGRRPVWGVFTYQCDVDIQDSTFYWREGVEHASYEHGYARRGSTWDNVDVIGSGAEGSKVRNDSQEIQWVRGAQVVRRNCEFRDWYQPWSWRGGGGIVLQGTGADVLIEKCRFYGAEGQRSRCVMIDDGGIRVDGTPDYYSASNGAPGGEFANGWVIIKKCAFFSGPGPDWWGLTIRVGNLYAVTPHKVARGVLIEDCGVWGRKVMGQFSHSPLLIRRCNTPAIKSTCDGLGMDTGAEAQIAGNPFRPFSAGAAVDVASMAEVAQP